MITEEHSEMIAELVIEELKDMHYDLWNGNFSQIVYFGDRSPKTRADNDVVIAVKRAIKHTIGCIEFDAKADAKVKDSNH